MCVHSVLRACTPVEYRPPNGRGPSRLHFLQGLLHPVVLGVHQAEGGHVHRVVAEIFKVETEEM